jgi:hypothetical protein
MRFRSKNFSAREIRIPEIEAWSFSGTWSLGFGASIAALRVLRVSGG